MVEITKLEYALLWIAVICSIAVSIIEFFA